MITAKSNVNTCSLSQEKATFQCTQGKYEIYNSGTRPLPFCAFTSKRTDVYKVPFKMLSCKVCTIIFTVFILKVHEISWD